MYIAQQERAAFDILVDAHYTDTIRLSSRFLGLYLFNTAAVPPFYPLVRTRILLLNFCSLVEASRGEAFTPRKQFSITRANEFEVLLKIHNSRSHTVQPVFSVFMKNLNLILKFGFVLLELIFRWIL